MLVRWTWLFLDLPEGTADAQVRFWQGVTGASLSPWRGGRGEFATLLPAAGDPWVKVQRVGVGGGVHLDLDVDVAPASAAEVAVGLGAAVVGELEDVVVCRSPGGFVFCLCPAGREGDPSRQARDGATTLVDQVCLDVPAHRYATEAAFWSALTGWPVDPGPVHDEFSRLTVPPALPLRVLLQRLDDAPVGDPSDVAHGGSSPARPVRAHVDLSSTDRGTEVARHVALGASRGADGRGWTVMTDPGGLVYCVTDRRPGVEPTARS